jgi:hypothetical protein
MYGSTTSQSGRFLTSRFECSLNSSAVVFYTRTSLIVPQQAKYIAVTMGMNRR